MSILWILSPLLYIFTANDALTVLTTTQGGLHGSGKELLVAAADNPLVKCYLGVSF